MAVAPGTRLGPYEVLAPIGAGGMGEVYRARDTRLDRTVAIKVLPSEVSADPERKARFEREARAISALSHPRICALHDVGSQDGREFLVMEYLEGETLAAKVERGALPLKQAAALAADIAEALAHAHRAGIVHGDLKPGNVMLTKLGLKLLDFGLAKLIQPAQQKALSALSSFPTQLSPGGPRTQEGVVLGTLQYMAPEQLEGKEADPRADVFALGAVLFEMASGRRAFAGSSQAAVIAAILSAEVPALSSIRPESPPALDRVVAKCLAKDPDDRWQSAADLAEELRWLSAESGAVRPGAPKTRRGLLVPALALAGVAAAAFLAGRWVQAPPRPAGTMRFSITAPPGTEFVADVESHNLALSPDGQSVAFVALSSGRTGLYVHSLAEGRARILPGTEGAGSPFWSPDGVSLAFFADAKLKKVPAAGGPVVSLADAPRRSSRGTWGADGRLLFCGLSAGSGARLERPQSATDPLKAVLAEVPAAGGSVKLLNDFPCYWCWPFFLPDGKSFVYLAAGNPRALSLGSLDTMKTVRLSESDSRAVWAPPDYLLGVHDGTLLAQRVDEAARKTLGDPVPLAEDMPYFSPTAWTEISASHSGTVAFLRVERRTQLAWVDRYGRELSRIGAPSRYDDLEISPDGRTLGFVRDPGAGKTSEIWLRDLTRDVESRFFSDPDYFTGLFAFSPDGTRIVFPCHGGKEPAHLRIKALSETGLGKKLDGSAGDLIWPGGWSPDGAFLFVSVRTDKAGSDIARMPAGGGPPEPVVATTFDERDVRLSPDGRFILYTSSESGVEEIYVQPASPGGTRAQVSSGGGSLPRWRPDGAALFYVAADRKLTEVPFGADPRPTLGAGEGLFKLESDFYAVAKDGKRFVVAEPLPGAKGEIVVIVNWLGALEAAARTRR
jgi:eukaryotic-like serine/threonine-protein kinase